jgi:hypothetical protein
MKTKPKNDLESILARLRRTGWMVAVHNDYRLGGKFMTFWLLTHPDGTWIKGEGKTDRAALAQAEKSITHPRSNPEGTREYLTKLVASLETMAWEAYNDGDEARSRRLRDDAERLKEIGALDT